jgi:formyl-CoA transferase
VQTSLLEAQIAMLDFQAARWTVDGEVPPQAGNHHPTGIPMGCFATADGHVNIAAPSGRLWRRFCDVLGEPGWPDDERFSTAKLRSRNREELNGLIAERLGNEDTAHWVDALTEVGVPCGPVNTIDQTFADPQVQHLGLVSAVEHDSLGQLGLVRNAVRMSRVPSDLRRPAPEAGQHSAEILADLGLSAERIAELRAAHVV